MEVLSGFLGNLISGVVFFLGLCLVVTIHEAGHFLAARWCGVEVEAFAIGWGKVLWSWKPAKTEYRICLLPVGGYCKMKGEQDLMEALQSGGDAFVPSPGSLFAASPLRKIAISAAGPVFNLVFAFLLLFLLQWTGVPVTAAASRIQLASEVDGRQGMPAQVAGLQTGDLVTAIDHQPVKTFEQIIERVSSASDKTLVWSVQRGQQQLDLPVTPKLDPQEKRALVGVYPLVEARVSSVEKNSLADLAGLQIDDLITAVDGIQVRSTAGFWLRVDLAHPKSHTVNLRRGTEDLSCVLITDERAAKEGVGLGFSVPTFPAQGLPVDQAFVQGALQTWSMFSGMLEGLGQLIMGKISPVQSLSGPIGMLKMSSETANRAFSHGTQEGITTVVKLFAFISLALFLMNLLPIPALDGGSIAVSLLEAARRRPLGLKALLRYQQVGVVVVLALLLFTTLNDVGLFGKS